MRKRFRVAGLVSACALAVLALATCKMATVPSITQWTITGTAQFAGTPPNPVLLGAFYYKFGVGTPFSAAPISNIVSLGTAAATLTPFTLNIDASGIVPAAGDSIFVQMWDDANLNNQMDLPGENNAYGRSDVGDAVFPTTFTCQFVFSGVAWYLGALTVQSATKTGAVITSLTAVN